MNKSDSIKNIATALAKFQEEVEDPSKGGVNTFFKNGKGEGSKYVELDDLLKAIRPVLSKNGLSVVQSPGGNGQDITITTMLMHSSGEWIEFEPLTLKAVKTDPQGAGSAITYGRRYSLSAVLGVAWDDDDDGNGASGKTKKDDQKQGQQPTSFSEAQKKVADQRQTEKQAERTAAAALINEGQRKALYAKCTKEGISNEDLHMMLKWKYLIDSVNALTIPNFSEVMNNLQKLWQEFVADQSKAG